MSSSDSRKLSLKPSHSSTVLFQILCDCFKSSFPLRLIERAYRRICAWQSDPLSFISALTSSHRRIENNSDHINNHRPPELGVAKIRGLPNQGQTCFLNSVLQALASLQPFISYLDKVARFHSDSLPTSASGYDGIDHIDDDVWGIFNTTSGTRKGDSCSAASFSRQLLHLLQQINGHTVAKTTTTKRRNQETNPTQLLQQIGHSHSQFGNAHMEQQDAQELLQALMSVVIHDAKLDCTNSCSASLSAVFDFEADDYDQEDTMILSSPLHTRRNQRQHSNIIVPISTAATTSNTAHTGRPLSPSNSIMSLSTMLEALVEDTTNSFSVADTQLAPSAQLTSNSNNDDSHRGKISNDIQKTQRSHARKGHPGDEKKQEDFDLSVQSANSEDSQLEILQTQQQQNADLQSNFDQQSLPSSIPSASMGTLISSSSIPTPPLLSPPLRIMQNAISSITPSPMSGWLGSMLQCCRCKHVRPIQNTPFLDIPLVPMSVPTYLASHGRAPSPSSPSVPGCSLEQCLKEFTSVERVRDVECKSCTIRRKKNQLEEEAMMVSSAIDAVLKRAASKNSQHISDEAKYLQDDLQAIESKLTCLRKVDPDGDEPLPATNENDSTDLDFDALLNGIDSKESSLEAETPKVTEPLDRCEAQKCLLLTRRPSIFCCHIQRRYLNPTTSRMEKCIEYVQFPSMLDISPYCAYSPRPDTAWAGGSDADVSRQSRTTNSMKYRLQSVIEHRGNAHGGHYIAYRRNGLGGWCRISDAAVTPVSWEQVRSCQAYMLFYEAA